MKRRQLLKQTVLTAASISLGKSLFARDAYPPVSEKKVSGIIKLTSNENPYGPSPLARKAMTDAVPISNRYPWEETTSLRKKIGQRFNLTSEHVVIGAGSSEILGLVGQYIANTKSHFVAPDNTFRIWRRAALDNGATMTKTDLTADKKFDLTAMEKAITTNTKLLYVCNPNNPTGTVVDALSLKNFIAEMSNRYMVVVDEAYLEYTNEPSMAGFVAANKNVIVVKTFSKLYGLAGARIGYALAHPDTIKLLNSMQPWPNAGASATAVAAAVASLDDTEFFKMVVEKNNAEKQKLYTLYTAMSIPYITSFSNFVYYAINKYQGDLQKEMEKRNILCGGIVEEKEKWTRITIGTPEEMNSYKNVLKEIIV